MASVTKPSSPCKSNSISNSVHENEDNVHEEQSEFVEPNAKKARTKTSECWKFFTDIGICDDGKQRVKCNGCGTRLVSGGSVYGTSHLKRHAGRCKKIRSQDISQAMLDMQGQLKARKIDNNMIRELVMDLVIKHDLPLKFVEYKEFWDLATYLNPDVNRMSRNTGKSVIQQRYSREKAMRALAAQFSNYLCRRKNGVNLRSRNFSSYNGKVPDELTIEEEADRKVGWLLKTIFLVTAGAAGYHFFPYMGENLMQQSVSLLRVKDPLFKRMGASRLTRFAIDDERRKKIVEMGGAEHLVNMLRTAKDDRTRKAALQALDALSHSDEALASLHHAGAISVVRSAPNSLEDAEFESFKLSLMKRFQDLRYDVSS